MNHVSAQGVEERMINVHYYYAIGLRKLSASGQFFLGAQMAVGL